MTKSSCKCDTKSKSHPSVKLAPVRVFSCKNPLNAESKCQLFCRSPTVSSLRNLSHPFSSKSNRIYVVFLSLESYIIIIARLFYCDIGEMLRLLSSS